MGFALQHHDDREIDQAHDEALDHFSRRCHPEADAAHVQRGREAQDDKSRDVPHNGERSQGLLFCFSSDIRWCLRSSPSRVAIRRMVNIARQSRDTKSGFEEQFVVTTSTPRSSAATRRSSPVTR